MRRSWAAVLTGAGGAAVVCAVGGWLVSAAGGPPLSRPTSLAADQVTVDNRGTTLVATGHVVVTYRTLRATSDVLRLNRSDGTAVFTGHVSVTDPAGRASGDTVTLFATPDGRVTRVVLAGHASVETPSYALIAERIVADRDADRLTADRHMTLFSQPDVIITGAHATYDRRTGHAVVVGEASARASVQNRDGRIMGTRLDFFRLAERVVIRGPVDADVFDAKLTGAGATIDLRQGIAVITGGATVSRRQGTLEADQLTVFYRIHRLIAEGATHMTYRDPVESPSP